jgi:hypothetical protein
MQEKTLVINDGSQLTIKQGDKLQLKDGRVLNVVDAYAPFGKIKMNDDTGGVAYVKPVDVIRIIQDAVEVAQEVKTFWTWFSQSYLGQLVLGLFKKKTA